MRRRKQEPPVAAEPQPEEEGFVHSSRQADLSALLAEYTTRSEGLAITPQEFRPRSIGALPAKETITSP